MQRRWVALAVIFAVPSALLADSVTIEPGRDATMIEDPDGAQANGSGPVFFVGRTGQQQNGIRRALLHFDVAAAIPSRAIIDSASLTLYLTESNPETRHIRVHRLLSDWGEGSSYSTGGGGEPATPGDVTWIHTFHDSDFWVRSGGQFVSHPSASLDVSAAGFYTWDDDHLAHDVRMWLAAPAHNFGWILIGDESALRTSKRFSSREDPDSALWPVLAVTYTLRVNSHH